MSSHQEIVHNFLKTSMRKWKFLKDHPTLSWKFARCTDCAVPLFSENFFRCVLCYELWMSERKNESLEEEEEEPRVRCCMCGDDAEDGPCRGFCSRSCLRDWNRA